MAWSLALSLVGFVGTWLTGRKSRWGWGMGIASQLMWGVYAVTTAQWGFLLSVAVFLVVDTRYFIAWSKDEKETTVPRIVTDPEGNTVAVPTGHVLEPGWAETDPAWAASPEPAEALAEPVAGAELEAEAEAPEPVA